MHMSLKHLFDLRQTVALVTGAASGLGRGIAEGFAGRGAAVAVADVNSEGSRMVTDGIRAMGGDAISVTCDVSNRVAVEAAVNTTLEAFGKIDVLVANAGIGMRSPAEEMTSEQWERVLEINLDGVWFFDQAVGRHMIERGEGGRIINMASIGGLVGVETGNANYCASKGGVIALTRCLAVEWAKHNILVNAIAPSHIRTPLIYQLMQEKPEVREYFLNNVALGRIGDVRDVVGPAIFLASEASAFVTGHVLVVDGGHTAK
jgi:NAD(P)-dependent dehydrogenase (short-subunit alcohol dehydrogenase family)